MNKILILLSTFVSVLMLLMICIHLSETHLQQFLPDLNDKVRIVDINNDSVVAIDVTKGLRMLKDGNVSSLVISMSLHEHKMNAITLEMNCKDKSYNITRAYSISNDYKQIQRINLPETGFESYQADDVFSRITELECNSIV